MNCLLYTAEESVASYKSVYNYRHAALLQR